MRSIATISIVMAAALLGAAAAQADGDGPSYDVTVTNLTRGQSFTPILVVTHAPGRRIFVPGEPANPELSMLAEGGDTEPLRMMLEQSEDVAAFETDGLLEPGHSVTVTVTARNAVRHLSLAAMLIPTNDGFMAFRDVPLPSGNGVVTVDGPAYDAGSEPNDESCAHIPGPVCGGEGASPGAGGEGFVHVHAGIHGIGDLSAAARDWRNPVARLVVRRSDRPGE